MSSGTTNKKRGPKPEHRTRWQIARAAALRTAKATAMDVWRTVRERGYDYPPSTIYAVLSGRFENATIQQAFCDVTHTDVAAMFSPEEPSLHWQREKRRAQPNDS